MERLRALCSPGLEPVLAKELRGLGLAGGYVASRAEAGGLDFQGSLRDIYRTNLRLRCAERVLLRFGEFSASEFAELRRKAAALAWEKYLVPGRPVEFHVDCEGSRLYHERAVAERLEGAVADRLGPWQKRISLSSPGPRPTGRGKSPSAQGAAQLVFVRLRGNVCSLSLDSSGELLHRRGYRLATAKAPLRETLACAMVLASGWEAGAPLLDPFCGSGTIPIEAALLARRFAPGRARRFAFMEWPGFDAKLWDVLLEEAANEVLPARPLIRASDRDAGAIRAARANAERAGVADGIEFSCRAFSAMEAPRGSGWVVTNPPYGVRLGKTGDLRDLYASFGSVLRERCPGWRASVLCANRRLIRATGLRFEQGLTTMNGGLTVTLASCSIGR